MQGDTTFAAGIKSSNPNYPTSSKSYSQDGRDDWIRTSDLCVPNAALCQAELHPVYQTPTKNSPLPHGKKSSPKNRGLAWLLINPLDKHPLYKLLIQLTTRGALQSES